MGIRDKQCGLRRAAALLFSGAVAFAAASSAAGELKSGDASSARQYNSCMQLAQKDAKKAQATASKWRASGGGVPAMHCLSIALLAMGYYAQAAENMEALAKGGGKLSASLRGDLYGQAGNAWTIAGKPERAYRVQSAALKLKPDDADLLIDRGITLAGSARYWEALDDLNRALEIAPGRADALTFRATAWRNLDSLELAEEDIGRALSLAPNNEDALLERGMIAAKKGDPAAARTDWLRVIELNSSSPPADAARAGLERLDLKVR
ncbi:MAG: tetratricopeptide repeat protein [Alphaproteobacteria bacterium]